MTAYLKIILRTFLFRKKRTLLTVLGIVIGSTLILTLVLLGEGMERALASQLQAFGGDLIIVTPGSEDDPLSAFLAGGEIKDADVRLIGEIDGVVMAMGLETKDFRVEFYGEEKIVNASGSPWAETRAIFEGAQGFELAEGDWPRRDDQDLVVLGSLVARDAFSDPVRSGDELVIDTKRFVVAGVFESLGNPDDDSRIYVSLDRMRALTGKRGSVGFVMARAESEAVVESVASDIRYEMETRGGSGDVTVLTSDTALRVVGDVLGVVQLVLASFAAVALIVGGIGIMNTMFTSVLERTREIGVMKALGATDRGILYLFLTEAGLLGAIGGLIGAGISYGFAKAIEYGAASQDLALLEIDFEPTVVLGTLAFTFVVGAVFGAVPAWRASRFNPTEALRYE